MSNLKIKALIFVTDLFYGDLTGSRCDINNHIKPKIPRDQVYAVNGR